MSGKIFYRERQKAQKGSRTPRFRIVAVSGAKLEIYLKHFRKTELEQLAKETGTELIAVKRDKKSKTKK